MPDQSKPPSFLRRIAVVIYDGLLLIAVLFLATLAVIPFHSEGAFEPNSILYSFYLLGVCFVFYGWFWTHGGQTLGLQTWKIRLVSDYQEHITWPQAFVRFVTAIASWAVFGLGFIWILFKKERLAWHDIASKSHFEWYEKE